MPKQFTATWLGAMLAVIEVAALAQPIFSNPLALGTLSVGELREASGVAASRNNDSVLWTHNDAGGGPRLFAVSTQGQHLGNYDLAGITKVDYEDIAIGPGPVAGVSYLFLGDIGDNNAKRNSIQVYQIPEPAVYLRQAASPPSRALKGFRQLDLTYPDGARNAETLMVDPLTGDLFIASKEVGLSRIYTATKAQLDVGGSITLSFVREIPFDFASGGDISPTGREIIIRKENFAWLWTRAPGQSVGEALAGAAVSVPVVGMPTEPNGEAIGFDAIGRGYFTLSDSANAQPVYYFDRATSFAVKSPQALIAAGSAWRYLDDGSDAGKAWPAGGYDDATWKTGEAQFGYGDNDERTLVNYGNSANSKFITTYFRKTFVVTNTTPLSRLELKLLVDDGAVAYFNGVALVRLNLGSNALFNTFATAAQEDLEDTWFNFDIDPGSIVTGTNVIAVEVHQAAANSPDFSFDAQLIAWPAVPTGLSSMAITPRSDGTILLALAGAGPSITIETSTNLWQWTELGVAPLTNGAGLFIDTNGTSHLKRFYRLRQ